MMKLGPRISIYTINLRNTHIVKKIEDAARSRFTELAKESGLVEVLVLVDSEVLVEVLVEKSTGNKKTSAVESVGIKKLFCYM